MPARLKWDQEGTREYQTGIDHGVLYVWDSTKNKYGTGVAWSGLTGVDEAPEGAEPTDLWADNIKYITLLSTETLKLTIKAYTYPEEFEECDGSASIGVDGVTIGQQNRKRFAFSYRTVLGNDTEMNNYGEKLHIVYGCLASPSERNYATINDSPEGNEFSWEVSTTPTSDVPTGFKPTASVEINSSTIEGGKTGAKYKKICDALWGVDPDQEHQITGQDAEVLSPTEIYTLLTAQG